MTLAVYPSRPIERSRSAADDPLAFLLDLASDPAGIVPFRLGRHPAFLLNDPAWIEHVLVRYPEVFVKGRGFDRARRLLGNGLLTASPETHEHRRSLAQPAFHGRAIRGYAEDVVRRARDASRRWVAGETLDLSREMRRLTLAIAGDAFFGADLVNVSDAVSRAVAMATPPLDGLLALVARPRQTREARRLLEDICRDVIAARRASSRSHDDLLGMLMAIESEIVSAQLLDDCLTFLLAGHDTLAHALTWTLGLVAQDDAVQERLHGESVATAQGSSYAEALPLLLHARSVLAEGMRLFPPAWVIVRRASQVHALGDTLIPDRSVLVASPFVTHRNPRFFPEPLRFDPSRWLTAESAAAGTPPLGSRTRWTYFPFGAGSRSCIGESFAWMAGTLVLSVLAADWRFSGPLEALQPSPRITLRPATPVRVTVAARARLRG